jgi:hypothetical protein
MKKMLIFIITSLLISGCASSHLSKSLAETASLEKTKNDIAVSAKSFEGQDKSILLRAWGAPKSISSDGKSGDIYQYANNTKLSVGMYTVFINMFINKDGKIYASDVKHLLQ